MFFLASWDPCSLDDAQMMMMNEQISLQLSGNQVDHLGQADNIGQLW